jgi:hypothetical protein
MGSCSEDLFSSLSGNQRVVCYRTGRVYSHPLVVEELTSLPHKLDNTAAIWMDELLHNYQFSCKAMYSFCKFIYMVREAEPTLNCLVEAGYRPDAAVRYYCYRLRRMCEMARKTPGGILVIASDIPKGLPLIEKYLNLKQPLRVPSVQDSKRGLVKWPLIEHAQKRYERYLYFLKNCVQFE